METGVARSGEIRWLHLTDLHAGLTPERWLWPNIEEALISDLRILYELTGPWHLVLFTGDITQSGSSEQFQAASIILDHIQAAAGERGPAPVPLFVPGNHDLVRPAPLSGVAALGRSWHQDAALREDFWNNPSNELRSGVETAFRNWNSWLPSMPPNVDYRAGLLPGDFSCTLAFGDLAIGVVGLNSSHLQLEGGDYRKKVTLDARQLDAVCPGGGAIWSQSHDCTFLLTHHPPSWLDTSGAAALQHEISPAGRFTAHLFGHQHDGGSVISVVGGGPPRCELLGKSLFGLESWGEPGNEQQRLHGYSAGCIRLDGRSRTLRLWPREGRLRQAGGWTITADQTVDLTSDGGTKPIDLGSTPVGPLRATPAKTSSSIAKEPADQDRIPGWRILNARFIKEHTRPLTAEAIGQYFDGAIPGWAHAMCDQIPRRPVVASVVAAIESAIASGSSRAAILLDAGGEGKSTALLQVAADFARKPGIEVLWRSESSIPLDAEAVLRLPGGPWLLVSDDAESIAASTFRVLQQCQVEDRRDIFFVLAARDTDWYFRKANRLSWGTLLERCPFGELDEPEAIQIVSAWSSAGPGQLRDLAKFPDLRSRARRFVDLARSSRARSTFFGAVLHARFSPIGLQSHVQTILERLSEHSIGRYSLGDAFLIVAALEAVGVEGVHRRVLAELLSLPTDKIGSSVVRPLGEEAAAVQAGDFILTRHPDIAMCAIVVAENTKTGDELAALYARIVRRTVLVNRANPLGGGPWFGAVVNVGRRIAENLPEREFSPDRRAEIALAAAHADREIEPTRLSAVVSAARTYRALERDRDGVGFLRQFVARLDEFDDYSVSIRGFWFEWAVCAAGCSDFVTSVILGSVALSDNLNPAPLNEKTSRLALAGLGAGFTELLKKSSDLVLGRALRAVAVLGRGMSEYDSSGLRFFAKYSRTADDYGIAYPSNRDEGIEWLVAAVRVVAGGWDDYISEECEMDSVTFTRLVGMRTTNVGVAHRQ